MLITDTTQKLKAIRPHSLYMRAWTKNHPYYYVNLYNRLFNELRQAFGGKCVVCGQLYSLEFAHLKETGLDGEGRGQRKRYYDIKNHPDAYTLMCKKHHEKFDHQYEDKLKWLQENAKFKYQFDIIDIVKVKRCGVAT